jgi:hypothetical protein
MVVIRFPALRSIRTILFVGVFSLDLLVPKLGCSTHAVGPSLDDLTKGMINARHSSARKK